MIRISNISVIFCLIILLTGCNGKHAKKPVWEETKIGDLAPSGDENRNKAQKIDAVNFQVHIFEVPAESIGKVDEVSKILYAGPIRFNHFNAFSANSFLVGFGRISLGDEIFQILQDANARKTTSISLLAAYGQAEDIPILKLSENRNIYYFSQDGTSQSATIGPGVLCLRIKAEKIPEFRGVSYVTIEPAFSFPLAAEIAELNNQKNTRDILFDCCGFGLKMSPGDYFFLRTQKYISHQNSLGSLFFSRPGVRPVVLAFLVVCMETAD